MLSDKFQAEPPLDVPPHTPTSGCAWASHASTQVARESAWKGFWPPDFADFLFQTSHFYGWLRSGGSTRMVAFTTRVSCCVFRVLGFNSNLFNFGPPSPGKLNPNGRVGLKLDGINNSGLKCYWACGFFFSFSFLRTTMDWGSLFFSFIIFVNSYIIFLFMDD